MLKGVTACLSLPCSQGATSGHRRVAFPPYDLLCARSHSPKCQVPPPTPAGTLAQPHAPQPRAHILPTCCQSHSLVFSVSSLSPQPSRPHTYWLSCRCTWPCPPSSQPPHPLPMPPCPLRGGDWMPCILLLPPTPPAPPRGPDRSQEGGGVPCQQKPPTGHLQATERKPFLFSRTCSGPNDRGFKSSTFHGPLSPALSHQQGLGKRE